MTVIINLLGSSGSGKSTSALGLGYQLKILGYKVENITEWVKEEIFAENFSIVKDQIYIFGKQRRKQLILEDKGLDFIVTDCPLILSYYYGFKYNTSDQHLDALIFKEFNRFDNVNFFLKRTVPFETLGRMETEEQSDSDSIEMEKLFISKGVDLTLIEESDKTQQILKKLNNLGYINV